MRITTSQLFDRPTAQMATLSARADTLQTQIATGKKFTSASGDPTGYARLASLDRAGADQAADAANVKLAQGVLAQTDSVLGSVQTQLQRVRELALQASNGTLGTSDRATIAAELDGIGEELVALANSSDIRGQPLFGAASGETPYARAGDGSVAFQGSGTASAIPIGGGDSVQTSVRGDTVFGNIAQGDGTTDMFALVASLAAALRGGAASDDAAIASALDGIDAVSEQVSSARASAGARAIRLDLVADRFADAEVTRSENRNAIEEVDMTSAIADLQKTLTILQATQASFTRLTSLSLFDQLR